MDASSYDAGEDASYEGELNIDLSYGQSAQLDVFGTQMAIEGKHVDEHIQISETVLDSFLSVNDEEVVIGEPYETHILHDQNNSSQNSTQNKVTSKKYNTRTRRSQIEDDSFVYEFSHSPSNKESKIKKSAKNHADASKNTKKTSRSTKKTVNTTKSSTPREASEEEVGGGEDGDEDDVNDEKKTGSRGAKRMTRGQSKLSKVNIKTSKSQVKRGKIQSNDRSRASKTVEGGEGRKKGGKGGKKEVVVDSGSGGDEGDVPSEHDSWLSSSEEVAKDDEFEDDGGDGGEAGVEDESDDENSSGDGHDDEGDDKSDEDSDDREDDEDDSDGEDDEEEISKKSIIKKRDVIEDESSIKTSQAKTDASKKKIKEMEAKKREDGGRRAENTKSNQSSTTSTTSSNNKGKTISLASFVKASSKKGGNACKAPNCKKTVPSHIKSLFCSSDCIQAYSRHALSTLSSERSGGKMNNERIVVFERQTGKIITGPMAPTEQTLGAWLLRHPSFEVMMAGKKNLMATAAAAGAVKKDKKMVERRLDIAQDIKVMTAKFINKDSIQGNVPFNEGSMTNNHSQGDLSQLDASTLGSIPGAASVGVRNVNTGGGVVKSGGSSGGGSGSSGGQFDPVRLSVRNVFRASLTKRANESDDVMVSMTEIKSLVMDMEEKLYVVSEGVNNRYKLKAKAIISQLKDLNNKGFFRRLLFGQLQPSELVRLTNEKIVSKEMAQWDDEECADLELMDETIEGKVSETNLIKKQNISTSRTPPSRAPLTSSYLSDIPFVTMDTTDKHGSHFFDMNCRICTGKEPEVNEQESIQQRQKQQQLLQRQQQQQRLQLQKQQLQQQKLEQQHKQQQQLEQQLQQQQLQQQQQQLQQQQKQQHFNKLQEQHQQQRHEQKQQQKHKQQPTKQLHIQTTPYNKTTSSPDDQPYSPSSTDIGIFNPPKTSQQSPTTIPPLLPTPSHSIHHKKNQNPQETKPIIKPLPTLKPKSKAFSYTALCKLAHKTGDDFVWCGPLINFQGVSFNMHTSLVSGNLDSTSLLGLSSHPKTTIMMEDLPETLHLVNKLNLDSVCNVVSAIKEAGTFKKDVVVVYMQACTETDTTHYSTLYNHLNSKNRCAVVSLNNHHTKHRGGGEGMTKGGDEEEEEEEEEDDKNRIKDMYIMSLSPHLMPPSVFLPFNGPGLPIGRRELLLGVIIKTSSSIPPPSSSSSASSSSHQITKNEEMIKGGEEDDDDYELAEEESRIIFSSVKKRLGVTDLNNNNSNSNNNKSINVKNNNNNKSNNGNNNNNEVIIKKWTQASPDSPPPQDEMYDPFSPPTIHSKRRKSGGGGSSGGGGNGGVSSGGGGSSGGVVERDSKGVKGKGSIGSRSRDQSRISVETTNDFDQKETLSRNKNNTNDHHHKNNNHHHNIKDSSNNRKNETSTQRQTSLADITSGMDEVSDSLKEAMIKTLTDVSNATNYHDQQQLLQQLTRKINEQKEMLKKQEDELATSSKNQSASKSRFTAADATTDAAGRSRSFCEATRADVVLSKDAIIKAVRKAEHVLMEDKRQEDIRTAKPFSFQVKSVKKSSVFKSNESTATDAIKSSVATSESVETSATATTAMANSITANTMQSLLSTLPSNLDHLLTGQSMKNLKDIISNVSGNKHAVSLASSHPDSNQVTTDKLFDANNNASNNNNIGANNNDNFNSGFSNNNTGFNPNFSNPNFSNPNNTFINHNPNLNSSQAPLHFTPPRNFPPHFIPTDDSTRPPHHYPPHTPPFPHPMFMRPHMGAFPPFNQLSPFLPPNPRLPFFNPRWNHRMNGHFHDHNGAKVDVVRSTYEPGNENNNNSMVNNNNTNINKNETNDNRVDKNDLNNSNNNRVDEKRAKDIADKVIGGGVMEESRNDYGKADKRMETGDGKPEDLGLVERGENGGNRGGSSLVFGVDLKTFDPTTYQTPPCKKTPLLSTPNTPKRTEERLCKPLLKNSEEGENNGGSADGKDGSGKEGVGGRDGGSRNERDSNSSKDRPRGRRGGDDNDDWRKRRRSKEREEEEERRKRRRRSRSNEKRRNERRGGDGRRGRNDRKEVERRSNGKKDEKKEEKKDERKDEKKEKTSKEGSDDEIEFLGMDKADGSVVVPEGSAIYSENKTGADGKEEKVEGIIKDKDDKMHPKDNSRSKNRSRSRSRNRSRDKRRSRSRDRRRSRSRSRDRRRSRSRERRSHWRDGKNDERGVRRGNNKTRSRSRSPGRNVSKVNLASLPNNLSDIFPSLAMFVRGGGSNTSNNNDETNNNTSETVGKKDETIPSLLDTMDPHLIPSKFRRVEPSQMPKRGLLGDFPLQKGNVKSNDDVTEKESEGTGYREDLSRKNPLHGFKNQQENNLQPHQQQPNQQPHHPMHQRPMQPHMQQQHNHQPTLPPLFSPFNNRFFNPSNIPPFIDAHLNRSPFLRPRTSFYPPRYPNMRFRHEFNNLPRMRPPMPFESKPSLSEITDQKVLLESRKDTGNMSMPKETKTE